MVGPSSHRNSHVSSPQVFSDDGHPLSSAATSARLTANEKRKLVENFLKDEHVFKVLYDTVFSSALESGKTADAGTLKSNSLG